MSNKNNNENLVLNNIKLAYYIVNKMELTENLYDDAISEALLALVEAANNYDSSKQYKFSTYAYNNIYYRVKTYVEKNKSSIGATRYLSDYRNKVKLSYDKFKDQCKDKYELYNAICEDLNITEYDISCVRNSTSVSSTEDQLSKYKTDQDKCVKDFISNYKKDEYLEKTFIETLIQMLKDMDISDRDINIFITLNFDETISRERIAKQNNICVSNVAMINKKVVNKIKQNENIKELINEYFESKHSKITFVK